MNKPLHIGFNTFDSRVRSEDAEFTLLLVPGVDWVFCHFDPDFDAAEQAVRVLRDRGYPFVANFEFQNFRHEVKSADGYDWANAPDGTHRMRFTPELIAALASGGNLIGVSYDEFEHVIINRNISLFLDSKFKIDMPAFRQLETRDAVRQGEALAADVKEYADGVKAMGAPVFSGEHVFPVLYHLFARSGVIPNFKSQKECFSNLQFAVAAGAALEYGTELWNCVDMWHKLTYPGHSAKELYHNLVFAYLSGVDRVYVEASSALSDEADGVRSLNENGKAFVRFASEYGGRERAYDARDYLPEIGIVRYDDTYWGQNLIWARGLFGNRRIKPDSRSKEWLQIVRTVTHRETAPQTFTWNRIDPISLLPHRSFVGMNGLAVFDDRVRRHTLESLKLCFLCGVRVSPETLRDVWTLVREEGLTVVCPPRFAPRGLGEKPKGAFAEYAYGEGTVIVAERFDTKALYKRLRPFLGNPGEIRLPFKTGDVRLKVGDDGETFEILS